MIPRETSNDISKTLQLRWINIAIRMFRSKCNDELHRFFLIVDPSKRQQECVINLAKKELIKFLTNYFHKALRLDTQHDKP